MFAHGKVWLNFGSFCISLPAEGVIFGTGIVASSQATSLVASEDQLDTRPSYFSRPIYHSLTVWPAFKIVKYIVCEFFPSLI